MGERYELGVEIGRGSNGVVWEAWDRSTERTVAVKELRPEVLASSAARKRFVREVESASALKHPHVVEVFADAPAADTGAYLVMERLFGLTLAARLRETCPLPQMRAIGIVAQILEAVGAAHELGIVHRDLKPSNVMLIERDGSEDFVKVCDFGLAKAYDEQPISADTGGLSRDLGSVTTELGQICGTPEYMAPEQARGDTLDARADIYSAAVILYHAVVGELPFKGRSPLAVISQHLASAPPVPSKVRPDLDIFPPLERLILRALAKDRGERPSSAQTFRADLLQIERDFMARRSQRTPRVGSAKGEDVTLPLHNPEPKSRRAASRLPLWVLGFGAVALAGALAWRNSAAERGESRRPSPPTAEKIVKAAAPTEHTHLGGSSSLAVSMVSAMPAPTATVVAPPTSSPTSPRVATRRAGQSSPPSAPAAAPSAPVRPEEPPQAEALLAEGRIAEACAQGQAAVTRAPNDANGWEFLGRCYMRLGRPEEARAAYRKYLALAPSGSRAVVVRAIVEAGRP